MTRWIYWTLCGKVLISPGEGADSTKLLYYGMSLSYKLISWRQLATSSHKIGSLEAEEVEVQLKTADASWTESETHDLISIQTSPPFQPRASSNEQSGHFYFLNKVKGHILYEFLSTLTREEVPMWEKVCFIETFWVRPCFELLHLAKVPNENWAKILLAGRRLSTLSLER